MPSKGNEKVIVMSISESDEEFQNEHKIENNRIISPRKGNALMFGILGFFAAVFPFSLIQLLYPEKSPIFFQWVVFGGVIQVYAATKEFELGNNLSGCIFLVFGSNWISRGISHLTLLANTLTQTDQIVWGLWFTVMTILTFSFTIVCLLDKKNGCWLLFFNLFLIGWQFLLCAVNEFSPSLSIVRISGIFGISGSLCGLYTFFVEAAASYGYRLPVGTIYRPKIRNTASEK